MTAANRGVAKEPISSSSPTVGPASAVQPETGDPGHHHLLATGRFLLPSCPGPELPDTAPLIGVVHEFYGKSGSLL